MILHRPGARVLFVLKHREDSYGATGSELSSGLANSVRGRRAGAMAGIG